MKTTRAMKSVKSIVTGLTANQEAFAQLIAKGYDNPSAYVAAYGAQSCNRKVLCEKAGKLAKQHAVSTYVEKLREDARVRGIIDRDEIVDWLKEIAVFGKQKQIRSSKFESYQELVDGSSANSAIDKLIKMGGLYAAEKVETEHKVKGKFVLNLKPRTDEA